MTNRRTLNEISDEITNENETQLLRKNPKNHSQSRSKQQMSEEKIQKDVFYQKIAMKFEKFRKILLIGQYLPLEIIFLYSSFLIIFFFVEDFLVFLQLCSEFFKLIFKITKFIFFSLRN